MGRALKSSSRTRYIFPALALLVGGAAGVLLTELALRILWSGAGGYYLWPPHLTAVFRPDPAILHGVGPVARIKANSVGVLGEELPAQKQTHYRILTIGGSTTQCIMLDQSKTWPTLLGQALDRTGDGRQVWLGNIGRAGFSSRDHIGAMRLVVSQYDPDAIVMLVGGNDMVIPLVQGEDYDPNFTRDEPRYWNWVISRFAIRPLSAWRGSFYRRTAIWQLARWAKSLRRISTHAMDTRGQFFANARRERQQRKVQQDKLPSLEPGLYEYDHNLRAIIEEARKRSIRIILLTQPSFWKDVMSPEEDRLLFYGFGERPTERTEKSVLYSPRALKAAMDMYNQRLLRICSDLNVECFDVASRLPKTMDVYFDDLHYTEQGAARFAQEVAAYLKGTAPFVSAAERADD